MLTSITVTPTTGKKAFIDFQTVEQATAAQNAILESGLAAAPDQSLNVTYTLPPIRENRSAEPQAASPDATDRIFIANIDPGQVEEARDEIETMLRQYKGFVNLFIRTWFFSSELSQSS